MNPEMSKFDLEKFANKIWEEFIDLEHINTFGENDLFVRGNRIKNFLGSVDRFKILFESAVNSQIQEIFDDHSSEE